MFCCFFASVAGPVSIVHAQAPQNVVILLPDDLEANDYPFLNNRSIEWGDPDNPLPVLPDPADVPELHASQPGVHEAAGRRPALNRLDARLFAQPDIAGTAALGRHTGDEPFLVVPVDLDDAAPFDRSTDPVDTTADQFRYIVPAPGEGCASTEDRDTWKSECVPETDVLAGYGGLARLVREGVTFPRFYASTVVCAPARGTLMTGRSPLRTEQRDFNSGLHENEVTIAEYLKQGCRDPEERLCYDREAGTVSPCGCYHDLPGDCGDGAPDPDDRPLPCYTTGVIGKWHLGRSQNNFVWPWLQGFDEFIGQPGGEREPFKREAIWCSPDTRRYCTGGAKIHEACTTNADCDDGLPGSQTCSDLPGFALSEPLGPKGLYIGPDPTAKNLCMGADAATNVDCCEPQEEIVKTDSYSFGKKTRADDEPVFLRDRWMTCNDDGDTSETGCLYYPRIVRDHAKKFIARHAGEPDPFFLLVSFTIPHKPEDAPVRTKAHYSRSRPIKAPQSLNRRYGDTVPMLEELDAAVGEILASLEDPNGDGDTADSVADRTLVLFTPDHGQNRKRFGNPNFFGGKSITGEGGVRVGLLARGPDLGLATGARFDDDRVTSLVDVFPTVAHVAGYAEPEIGLVGSDGRLTKDLLACNIDGEPCQTNDDCGEKGPCGRKIDGASMLPVLTGAPLAPDERDFAYAWYSGRGNKEIIASRRGYVLDELCGGDADCTYAAKMCALDSQVRAGTCRGGLPEDEGRSCRIGVSDCPTGICEGSCAGGPVAGAVCDDDTDCAGGTCVGRVVHRMRGGSCTSCVTDDDCTAAGEDAVACPLTGKAKVCLSSPEVATCTDSLEEGTRCIADEQPGCRNSSECTADALGNRRTCVAVRKLTVHCRSCVTATWKLRGDERTPQFFDLASNAEEDEKRLNCADESTDPRVDATLVHFRGLLGNWFNCSDDRACNHVDCENTLGVCPIDAR